MQTRTFNCSSFVLPSTLIFCQATLHLPESCLGGDRQVGDALCGVVYVNPAFNQLRDLLTRKRGQRQLQAQDQAGERVAKNEDSDKREI